MTTYTANGNAAATAALLKCVDGDTLHVSNLTSWRINGATALPGAKPWRQGQQAGKITVVTDTPIMGSYHCNLWGIEFKGQLCATTAMPACRIDGGGDLLFTDAEIFEGQPGATYSAGGSIGLALNNVAGAEMARPYFHDVHQACTGNGLSFFHAHEWLAEKLSNDCFQLFNVSDLTIENGVERNPAWDGKDHPDFLQIEPNSTTNTNRRLTVRNNFITSQGQGLFAANGPPVSTAPYDTVVIDGNVFITGAPRAISIDLCNNAQVTNNQIFTLAASPYQSVIWINPASTNIVQSGNTVHAIADVAPAIPTSLMAMIPRLAATLPVFDAAAAKAELQALLAQAQASGAAAFAASLAGPLAALG